jgi:hypothetical protein
MLDLRPRRAAACAAVLLLALGGSAAAAGPPDTTITVSPRVEIAAPQESPADFPGVSRVRKGAALPRRWFVVSRDVRFARGQEVAFAALRMTCPRASTWRSGSASPQIGVSVLDRNARARKSSVLVMATFPTSEVRVGEAVTGTVFALCR